MFIEESLWIREKLAALNIPNGGNILNIGASTSEFLRTQPHIHENVIKPLKDRGCRMINMDIKKAVGVDIVGKIEEKGLCDRIGEKFVMVMCTNLLEHVEDRDSAFSNMIALAGPGGFLLVTVPRNYPMHDDPVDTMYRPSHEELAAEISIRIRSEIIASETLEIRNRMYYFYESRLPFWGYRKFRFWRYWFKKYRWKVSCVICRILGPR